MITKRRFAAVLTATLIAAALVVPVGAQEPSATTQPERRQADIGSHSYRLDYTLTESENGKKIDSRRYSINVGGEGQTQRSIGHVEIGNKVPIETKSDGSAQSQYVDVGTKITGTLYMRGEIEVLDTSCDVSSVAPEQTSTNVGPVLRTLQMNNVMPLVEGKSLLVGTADDPNSNREFQLEVTVTQLK